MWETNTIANQQNVLYEARDIDNDTLFDVDGSQLYIIGDSSVFTPNRQSNA